MPKDHDNTSPAAIMGEKWRKCIERQEQEILLAWWHSKIDAE